MGFSAKKINLGSSRKSAIDLMKLPNQIDFSKELPLETVLREEMQQSGLQLLSRPLKILIEFGRHCP